MKIYLLPDYRRDLLCPWGMRVQRRVSRSWGTGPATPQRRSLYPLLDMRALDGARRSGTVICDPDPPYPNPGALRVFFYRAKRGAAPWTAAITEDLRELHASMIKGE